MLLPESKNKKDFSGQPFTGEEKNVRRRVYDAINVLLACGIIAKDKKRIHWKGLPTKPIIDVISMEQRVAEKKESIMRKRAYLNDLITRNVCVHNLSERNRVKREKEEQEEMEPAKVEGDTRQHHYDFKIGLPFISISTSACSEPQLEMSSDQNVLHFKSDQPIEIADDMKYMRQLGM